MTFNLYIFVVFIIQFAIAGLNYYIAHKHHEANMKVAEIIDILCGISWTMTGLYKLAEAFGII